MVKFLNGAFKAARYRLSKPANLKMVNFLFQSRIETASKFLKHIQLLPLQLKPVRTGNAQGLPSLGVSLRAMTRIISACDTEEKAASKYSLTWKLLKHNCFCFSRCGNWEVENLSNAHSAHIKPNIRSQKVWGPPCPTAVGSSSHTLPFVNQRFQPKITTSKHKQKS